MVPRRPIIVGLCLIVSLNRVQSSEDGLLHSSAVSRMLSSMDMSDQEVDLLERHRREVARDRDLAGVCERGSNNGSFPVGCVMEGTIPEGETYIVHFKHEESGDDPSICWQTCQAVFPNTSLALVAWEEVNGMSCHCGLSDAVNDSTLGPQRCCSAVCEKSGRECGGGIDFSNGYSEKCYSVYCVPNPDKDKETSKASARTLMLASRSEAEVSNRIEGDGDNNDVTTTEGEGGDEFDAEVEALLNSLYLAQRRSNIVDIVIAGLLGVVIILVLILLVWAYMFVEAINDPRNAAHAAFYRRLSGVGRNNRQPNLNGGNGQTQPQPSVTAELDVGLGNKEANYGSTNQAFDPTPDTDPVFVEEDDKSKEPSVVDEDGPDPSGITNPRGSTSFYGDNLSTQSSVMTDETEAIGSVGDDASVGDGKVNPKE